MSIRTFAPPILQVWDCGLFPRDILKQAQADSAIRKNVLRMYRTSIVRPALMAKDAAAYAKDADKELPGLGCRFRDLGTLPRVLRVSDLGSQSHPLTWRFYRIWSIVRLTGMWPAFLYNLPQALPTLPQCPACGTYDVSVRHTLTLCSESIVKFLSLPAELQSIRQLFHCDVTDASHALRVEYVGFTVHKVLVSLCPAATPTREEALVWQLAHVS
jgi:hypothetical protein